jgi:uncharacterized tellurite resistance protein B-like protein
MERIREMNEIKFSDHSLKKQNLDYYIYLVHVALADGIISNREWEMLNRVGQKLGFSETEIDTIIDTSSKSDYFPPYELSERFEQVYEVVKMILADGVIDKNEMRLAATFAMRSSFPENEIPGLLTFLMSGIREGKDEEELFEAYKRAKRG